MPQVIKALTSLKSRGYVKEQFAWRHFYWYLTNEGAFTVNTFLPFSVVDPDAENLDPVPGLWPTLGPDPGFLKEKIKKNLKTFLTKVCFLRTKCHVKKLWSHYIVNSYLKSFSILFLNVWIRIRILNTDPDPQGS